MKRNYLFLFLLLPFINIMEVTKGFTEEERQGFIYLFILIVALVLVIYVSYSISKKRYAFKNNIENKGKRFKPTKLSVVLLIIANISSFIGAYLYLNNFFFSLFFVLIDTFYEIFIIFNDSKIVRFCLMLLSAVGGKSGGYKSRGNGGSPGGGSSGSAGSSRGL